MFQEKKFQLLNNWIQVGSIRDYGESDSDNYYESAGDYFLEDICQFNNKKSGIIIDVGVYNNSKKNVFPGYTLLAVNTSLFQNDPALSWDSPLHKSIHFTSKDLIRTISFLLEKYK